MKVQNDQITTTVIDILSSTVEFSIFLRILQRNQMIPHLNQLGNITLVAPINSAFTYAYPNHNEEQILQEFDFQDLSRYIIDQPINSKSIDGVIISHSKALRDDHERTISSPVLIRSFPEDGIFEINNLNVIETDLFADTQNSYVQGISKTFNNIVPLQETLDKIPDLSIFNKIIEGQDLQNKTVLAFNDSVMSLFTDYQLNYLFNKKYGGDDLKYILDSLILNGVFGGILNVTTYDNNGFKILFESESSGESLTMNSTIKSTSSNILSSNGIIHIFEDQEIIQEIQLNVLKTLVGLDCTSFVDELIFQDLSHLITDDSIEQTIFHTRDNNQNERIYTQSKGSNLYHFIKDLNLDNLYDINTTLFTTDFCSSKKLGSRDHCQRLKIEKFGNDSIILNNNILVESGPYIVGNTSIYLTDEELSTPGDLFNSIGQFFHCATSLKYLHEFELNKLPKNKNGYTYLLPCFNSYDNFGLTLNYLEQNPLLLEKVMKNFILEGLLYTDSNSDYFNWKNLNKDIVQLSNINFVDDKFNFNFNNLKLSLQKGGDIIFNQGVAQPLNHFFLPDSIEILNEDIIKSVESKLFMRYLSFFPYLKTLLNNHTVLLPSATSLSKSNFEYNSTLEQLLTIHLIPKESTSKLLNCADDITTLNNKINLTCTRPANHDAFLSIKDDKNNSNFVRILTKGCNNDQDLCVFEIDQPITFEDNHFHISLPGIAFAVGILLGSLSMVLVLICLMLVFLRKRKDSVRRESDEQFENERSSLISNSSNYNINSNGNINSDFDSGYSTMAVIDPINVKKTNK
ncbi:hypothetical protein WICMUC_000541 [Wickerhamomyces mucosus]|uniref:FAS1 domain-containing protein n=1 Tax=Wickerhamomyces mucosus TaxID=1378264 RepID=A0A9P8PYZ4_9ASCO|nr:hypothetical protein WICMUC_000541 [Wickerhamomyces mucosus]